VKISAGQLATVLCCCYCCQGRRSERERGRKKRICANKNKGAWRPPHRATYTYK